MSRALEGEHYCEAHQGNFSYYAEINCTICQLLAKLARKDAEITKLKEQIEQLKDNQNGN